VVDNEDGTETYTDEDGHDYTLTITAEITVRRAGAETDTGRLEKRIVRLFVGR
jgi:hypothetical protein